MKTLLAAFVLTALLVPRASLADSPPRVVLGPELAAPQELLRDRYVDAYNRGDAQALAALWTPEAVLNNHAAGVQLKGRAEIEKYMAGLFAGKKQGSLAITLGTTASVSVAPMVSMQTGTATLTTDGAPPQESTLTAVVVERDGQWLIDRMSEDLSASAAPAADGLANLGWMVGAWMYEDETQVRLETTVQWLDNRRVLCRSFRAFRGQQSGPTGTELITFDPSRQALCSWVYLSDGTRGEGVWKQEGNQWAVRETGTVAGDGSYSAVNLIRFVNDNTFVFQATQRILNGRSEPDTRAVLVARTGTIDTASDAD